MLPQKFNQKEIAISYRGHNFLLKISHGQEVNLTDLWKAVGAPKGKETWNWLEQDGTRQFVEVFCDSLNLPQKEVLRTARGKGGGTWAHWQIALAYAKYLSPKLHLAVNQVFKERLEEERDPELGVARARERQIKVYQKQGKSPEWIQARLNGIEQRNSFTSSLARHGVDRDGFPLCTDATYRGVLGGSSRRLKEKHGLEEDANLRDSLTKVGSIAVALSEAIAEERIEQEDHYGNSACARVCEQSGRSVRKALRSSKVDGIKKLRA